MHRLAITCRLKSIVIIETDADILNDKYNVKSNIIHSTANDHKIRKQASRKTTLSSSPDSLLSVPNYWGLKLTTFMPV